MLSDTQNARHLADLQLVEKSLPGPALGISPWDRVAHLVEQKAQLWKTLQHVEAEHRELDVVVEHVKIFLGDPAVGKPWWERVTDTLFQRTSLERERRLLDDEKKRLINHNAELERESEVCKSHATVIEKLLDNRMGNSILQHFEQIWQEHVLGNKSYKLEITLRNFMNFHDSLFKARGQCQTDLKDCLLDLDNVRSESEKCMFAKDNQECKANSRDDRSLSEGVST